MFCDDSRCIYTLCVHAHTFVFVDIQLIEVLNSDEKGETEKDDGDSVSLSRVGTNGEWQDALQLS